MVQVTIRYQSERIGVDAISQLHTHIRQIDEQEIEDLARRVGVQNRPEVWAPGCGNEIPGREPFPARHGGERRSLVQVDLFRQLSLGIRLADW